MQRFFFFFLILWSSKAKTCFKIFLHTEQFYNKSGIFPVFLCGGFVHRKPNHYSKYIHIYNNFRTDRSSGMIFYEWFQNSISSKYFSSTVIHLAYIYIKHQKPLSLTDPRHFASSGNRDRDDHEAFVSRKAAAALPLFSPFGVSHLLLQY